VYVQEWQLLRGGRICSENSLSLHDALANVHDGRALHAEHVIFRLKQPPHGLGQ